MNKHLLLLWILSEEECGAYASLAAQPLVIFVVDAGAVKELEMLEIEWVWIAADWLCVRDGWIGGIGSKGVWASGMESANW